MSECAYASLPSSEDEALCADETTIDSIRAKYFSRQFCCKAAMTVETPAKEATDDADVKDPSSDYASVFANQCAPTPEKMWVQVVQEGVRVDVILPEFAAASPNVLSRITRQTERIKDAILENRRVHVSWGKWERGLKLVSERVRKFYEQVTAAGYGATPAETIDTDIRQLICGLMRSGLM